MKIFLSNRYDVKASYWRPLLEQLMGKCCSIVSCVALQIKAQLCFSMLDRPPGPMWGDRESCWGEQGLRKVKTKALLLVGVPVGERLARGQGLPGGTKSILLLQYGCYPL